MTQSISTGPRKHPKWTQKAEWDTLVKMYMEREKRCRETQELKKKKKKNSDRDLWKHWGSVKISGVPLWFREAGVGRGASMCSCRGGRKKQGCLKASLDRCCLDSIDPYQLRRKGCSPCASDSPAFFTLHFLINDSLFAWQSPLFWGQRWRGAY